MGNKGERDGFAVSQPRGCSVLMRLRSNDLGSDKTDTPYSLAPARRRREVRKVSSIISNNLSRAGEGMPRAPIYMSFFFWIHAATWRPHETGTQSEPAM